MRMIEKMQQRKAEKELRAKLTDCFHAAGIYLHYKSGKFEKFIYPTIHSVKATKEKLEYVFTLPNGLDPKEVTKKEYAFKQFYGRTLELGSDGIKKYTLTVYAKSLKKEIMWRYDEIAPHVTAHPLPIVCGQDLNGQLITFNLVTHPHLLISGRTGSGKSSQLRSILMTLIKTCGPDQLELYLADLKMAEFQFFRRVEHVKYPLCLTVKETKKMLIHVVNELEKRQQLIYEEDVAHVKDLEGEKKVPFIVIAIDEFATLKNDTDAMDALEEIGNRGRALGVYLVLSILRPDSNIINGRIKNNLNAVMGFRCKNLTNANVIGTPGAEKLTVKGRFLLDIEEYTEPKEMQALYLSEKRLKKLLEPYKTQKNEKRTREEEKPEEVSPTENKIFGVLDE